MTIDHGLDVARQRLLASRLVGSPFTAADEVVRWLGAVQAQDHAGASWGIAQRAPGLEATEVATDFDAGTCVRTHAMRPTWHLLAAEDVRWVQRLTAPRVHVVNGSMYRQLDLNLATLERGADAIASALQAGGHLTRSELVPALEEAGIAVTDHPRRGPRLAYLVMFAELEQVIASGPMRGKQHTYALLDDRVPPAPDRSRDDDLAALAERYFRARGPATAKDLSWWSGLTVGDATRAIERAGVPPTGAVDGRTRYAFAPPDQVGEVVDPAAHLLPNYDELFIGFADRRDFQGPTVRSDELPPGVFDAHVVTVNGRAVGGWRRTVTARGVRVDLQLVVEPGPVQRDAITQAARQYATWLDRTLELDMEMV